MPWARTSPVQERIRFVRDYRSGLYTMTELCERFGVSRKTGYKWLRRVQEDGASGLEERSRVARGCPHRMAEHRARAIVAARRLHPTWGPRKLLAWLRARAPEEPWPAASSAGELLKREGLVRPRSRRRKSEHPGRPTVVAQEPNDVWTADFKGQFRVRDWGWCYPLTIADLHSRYLLGVQALDGTDVEQAQPVFERVFREAGLPRAIQTDNGAPFVAPRGLLGLTQLSVWWIRLGIRPLRIQPAHPEQNGAHERMHRTLKAETTRPVAGNRAVQQRRFNRFRKVYNEERPHEALDQVPPARRWSPSPRSYPERLPPPDYPDHYLKRLVSDAGAFGIYSRQIYLSTALRGEWIGLEETDDGIWSVFYCDTLVGRYDQRDHKIYG